MGELWKKFKEQMPDYAGLVSFVVIGIVLRLDTCGPSASITRISAIGFIAIGIAFGLVSFILRHEPPPSGLKKIIFEVSRGAITGFGIGWGGITALILAFQLCG